MGVLDLFKYGTVRLQANLSAFELSTETLRNKYNVRVETLNLDDNKQLAAWCDIINHSYSEFNYNVESAKVFLKDEKYYKKAITYLFSDCCGGGYCATVSVAQYVAAPHVGGDFKLGVKKESQGRGLGRLIVLYAFSRLKERGIDIGESSIMIKRSTSLYLHFKLGFRPQFNPKYFALPASSKLYPIVKAIPLLKLWIAYKRFIDRENRKI